jgi:hypothetical protein
MQRWPRVLSSKGFLLLFFKKEVLFPLFLILLVAASAVCYRTTAVLPAPAPPPSRADYSNPANWVCRPGRNDACGGMLPLPREPNPKIDCFYVYPTTSMAPTANAPLAPAPEVTRTVHDQFAPFAAVCRPFAPLYRQRTLRALAASGLHLGTFGDRTRAYNDVRDAWHTYLARDNQGRGFVLIGHSQGGNILARLLREEIDGKPIQSRLVSAILPGHDFAVPDGTDSPSEFRVIKPCRAAPQTGCLIAYAAFRADSPPGASSAFGRNPEAGQHLLCTNPAALAGGTAPLTPYFPSATASPTLFIAAPTLLAAACVHTAHATYLSVAVTAAPDAALRAAIGADSVLFAPAPPKWGLHVLDLNLTLGNLIQIILAQSASFAPGKP